jgi:hypothetical protein
MLAGRRLFKFVGRGCRSNEKSLTGVTEIVTDVVHSQRNIQLSPTVLFLESYHGIRIEGCELFESRRRCLGVH